MSLRLSSKLCGRKEPERGCLARVTCSAPKDSSPILHLPSEIRACIFNYIINDVDLIYRCTRDFESFQCVASWSDYNRKLSFLQVCKLFRAEAWTLIQVKSVTFEKPEDQFTSNVDANSQPLPEKFGPQEVPLPLSRVQPHLREIRLDPTTLVLMLETDFLSTFPKLQQIRVTQRHISERRGAEFRAKLDDPLERRDILRKQLELRHCYQYFTSRFDKPSVKKSKRCVPYRRLQLSEILDRAMIVTELPIVLEAVTEYNERSTHGSAQYVEPVYPVLGNVSTTKMIYEWRTKRFVGVDVNMWNQPMEMAVKSKFSESVLLTKEELGGVDVLKAG